MAYNRGKSPLSGANASPQPAPQLSLKRNGTAVYVEPRGGISASFLFMPLYISLILFPISLGASAVRLWGRGCLPLPAHTPIPTGVQGWRPQQEQGGQEPSEETGADTAS